MVLLGYWRPHEEFQHRLEQQLLAFLPEHEKQIRFYADILEKVYTLNLDLLLALALSQYSHAGRALVVMCHHKESITRFVKRLKAHPVLAIVCGFEPDSVPGVGTFYKFLDRLWLEKEPANVTCGYFVKRARKPKGGEKLPDTDSNRVSDLVKKVLAKQPLGNRPEILLQKILTGCAVKPSLELKLCGDRRKFSFAGDGAPLATGANHRGKRTCSCKEQGIFRCSCPRQYTGPTANWGRDSYHEQWFYGHTLYCITAACLPAGPC